MTATLPSFCTCLEGNLGFNLTCAVDLAGMDTVTYSSGFEPCKDPAWMGFDVSDKDTGFSCCKKNLPCCGKFVMGDEPLDMPIPGLDIVTPVGGGGPVLAVDMKGDLDALTLTASMDVCVVVPVIGKKCGSKVTSALPVKIISGTYDFSHACPKPPDNAGSLGFHLSLPIIGGIVGAVVLIAFVGVKAMKKKKSDEVDDGLLDKKLMDEEQGEEGRVEVRDAVM